MLPRRALIIIMAIVVMMSCSTAEAEQVRWIWAAPTDGGLVEGYEFQVNTDNDGWVTFNAAGEAVLVDMPGGTSVCRVRAWNTDNFGDRQYGPWSPVSDPFTSIPAPGGCGTPLATASQ